jgi:cytochrome c-type biogenesis protein CcmE
VARQAGARSPARLIVALSVAGVLAVFLLYTALGGNSTPLLEPSNLADHAGTVSLTGKVVGPVAGDAHSSGGLRFALRDITGTGSPKVPVVFRGSVPDLFKAGRDVNLTGRVEQGTFVANQMTTKCPSKYTAAKGT